MAKRTPAHPACGGCVTVLVSTLDGRTPSLDDRRRQAQSQPSSQVQALWSKDIAGKIAKANAIWSTLATKKTRRHAIHPGRHEGAPVSRSQDAARTDIIDVVARRDRRRRRHATHRGWLSQVALG